MVVYRAMKCSAMQVNGEWRDVYKSPVGDVNKASKKGRLALIRNAHGDVQTVREEALADGQADLLQTVFENGRIVANTTFDAIRERAAVGVRALVTSRALRTPASKTPCSPLADASVSAAR